MRSRSASGELGSTGSRTVSAPVDCMASTYVSATRCAVWSQNAQRARSRTAQIPITGAGAAVGGSGADLGRFQHGGRA